MARDAGFYWVKVRSRPISDPWDISHWSGSAWRPHHPAEIIEIDERRIERPAHAEARARLAAALRAHAESRRWFLIRSAQGA